MGVFVCEFLVLWMKMNINVGFLKEMNGIALLWVERNVVRRF
jgi:hypothetical protein